MAIRNLFGGPPPANVTDFPPGTVWIHGKVDDAVNPMQLLLDVYGWQPPSAIAWGDNNYQVDFTAAAEPPVEGGAPGRWACSTIYAKPLSVSGYVEAGGTRLRFKTANFQTLRLPDLTAIRDRREALEDELAAGRIAGQAAAKVAQAGPVN